MDESSENLLNISMNSSLSSSGPGSLSFSASEIVEVPEEDEISNYLSRLSPNSQRRLDEFVQITDYGMPSYHPSFGTVYQLGASSNQTLVDDQTNLPFKGFGSHLSCNFGGSLQENLCSIPEVNYDVEEGSQAPVNFVYGNCMQSNHYLKRPVTMYEPYIEPEKEFSSLPPDLILSNDHGTSIDNEIINAKKMVWEAEDADYIETIDESRDWYDQSRRINYPTHYESVPVLPYTEQNAIIVAADVHQTNEDRRYEEIAIYATVKKKNKSFQDLMVSSNNSAGDPPLQKLPKIMTQSCYGELNIPTPEQSGNWSSYNEYLIKSSENILEEGSNYNVNSIMTGTTNSSIIDGTSSMNSSIYEQIPSMNSSAEMAMRKSVNDRNRVKWWDDMSEETNVKLQELVNQAHLVNIEDERWKNLRNKLTPTFTSGKIKMMFQTVSEVTDNLVNHMELKRQNNSAINMKDCLGKYTTDVIGCCAFGIDCNSLKDPDSEFFKMGQKVFEFNNFFFRFLRSSFPNIARKLHVKSVDPEVSKFYTSIVQNTVDYRMKNDVNRNDFMNLLVQMMNSRGEDRLTFEEVAAQSFIFFVAGYETTATTLTFCMYELAINEEIQDKARDHVREVLKNHNGQYTYDAIIEMNYLEKIINEALRKYPPAPAVGRAVKHDYKIPDTDIVLEKGTGVNISIHGIHHDPEIYPNPDKFDPERFSPEEIAKRHPLAYIPFGEGPRVCIGMRFALIEARIALAKLLSNFKFELDRTKTSVPMKFDLKKILLHPKEGIYVKLQKV